jgi:lipopolysaccharide/colanic/teichoic acid biosynthesis glycosyltransferase
VSRIFQLGVKCIFDMFFAALSLVVLSPVFLLIAVLIKLDSIGPVFYLQERVGLEGCRFTVAKFRTMVDGAERIGSGLYVTRDDHRITRMGRILRRFSLDELPQLWNVLAGEMSLVGPRPAVPYQVRHYTQHQARRLAMRPGITGWSQVCGRNALSWPQRIEKDVWYVDHFSLGLDARIIFRTVRVCLRGEGLYAERGKFFLTGKDDIPDYPWRAA